MKPLFLPLEVNDPFRDPVVYLDFLFERRALLLDAGDLRELPTRKLLRVSDVLVSHTHMDHFADFDWLLRLCLGRDKTLRLYGPAGFADRVEHKLGAYTWNLVGNYDTDLCLEVTELHAGDRGRRVAFRCREGFARREHGEVALPGGVLREEPALRLRAAVLDHGVPCLGYRVEEKVHVSLWKDRIEALGLGVGPWLRELKAAVVAGRAADTPIRARWREAGRVRERRLPLGQLMDTVVRLSPGQKLGYIVDVAYHEDNARRIAELLRDADVAFVEAAFMEEHAGAAARKRHLTARQAGLLARRAGIRDLRLFHHSPRYAGRRPELVAEAEAARAGD